VVTAGPLIVCTLYGGNDGLNTVVPYAESAYHQLRGDLAVPEADALPLGNVDGVLLGLHPSLTSLQAMFQAGTLAVVLGVEYPNPNYSHFQSMDIWQTTDLSGNAGPGWIGRWLDATGSDPLRALAVGSQVPMAFAGAVQQAGTLVDSTYGGAQLPNGDPLFASAYAELMKTARKEPALDVAVAHSGQNLLLVGNKAETALNTESVPPNLSGRDPGDLGNQLDIVAELVEYGLPTKAYGVSMGGFDTHANEAGQHSNLLSQLDAAIQNFMGVFTSPSAGKNPVLLVHSEFGRRPEANASGGTDHGSASVMFVVGPAVKGGFYGAMPSLTKLDNLGNLVVTTDFRSVYATVLEKCLGIDNKAVLGKKFPTIPFL
jgi:uncharacterized protein (DUF1501 family)